MNKQNLTKKLGINTQMHNRNNAYSKFSQFLLRGNTQNLSFFSGLGRGKWFIFSIESTSRELSICSVFNESLIADMIQQLEPKNNKISGRIDCLGNFNKKTVPKVLFKYLKLVISSCDEDYMIKIKTKKSISQKTILMALHFLGKQSFYSKDINISSKGFKISLKDDCWTVSSKKLQLFVSALNQALNINLNSSSNLLCYVEITSFKRWKGKRHGKLVIVKEAKVIKSAPF